jgi:hypothetical protein
MKTEQKIVVEIPEYSLLKEIPSNERVLIISPMLYSQLIEWVKLKEKNND